MLYKIEVKISSEGISEYGWNEEKGIDLVVKCGRCNETRQGAIHLDPESWDNLNTNDRTRANVVLSCKFCRSGQNITLFKDSLGKCDGNSACIFQQLMILDCRGLEPIEVQPSTGMFWAVSESGAKFNSVELPEWYDYDENSQSSVSIGEGTSAHMKNPKLLWISAGNVPKHQDINSNFLEADYISVSDVDGIKEICTRKQICSAIIVQIEANNLEYFFESFKNILSILYGRNKRPLGYVTTSKDQTNFEVFLVLQDGSSISRRSLHIDELLNDIILRSEKFCHQPTDYMLERNALSEPLWLVNAIGGCFEELSGTEVFPESFSGPEIEESINDRSFHSPSLSDDDSLYSIWYIFESLQLLDALDISKNIFKKFLLVLRANYKPNPYHNFQHAVDVLQFAYLLLRSSPIMCEILSSLELFSLLLAAIGHDVGHTSYNNRFHCSAESLLCVLFNDQSVLENYHSLIIFAILRHPEYNFCPTWSEERWQQFRKMVISCILGTDMAAHFKYVKQFSEAGLCEDKSLDQESRNLLAIMIIKCADISNIIRPFDMARRWGFKLVSEFFCQGDWERYLGQEPGFLNDRFAFDLAKSQEHFMLQVAAPLFRFAGDAFPGTSFCINGLEQNVECWRNWVPEEDEIVQASEDFRPYMRTKTT